MDEYIGKQIVDQLREMNVSMKDFIEKKNEEHFTELTVEAAEERLTFHQELVQLIDKHGMGEYSKSPGWIVGDYLMGCLRAFDLGVVLRDQELEHSADGTGS